ncbi:hypothetical protein [Hespellia stercorisuis]|uniref:Uncharacterized protein n=1 Tax=Hespellia stercorisuis DSM 15480 TaxID=1121950 RepID=A0A1M6UEI7_9FIRM|nr:hypothetical protein [Hespellia stercorisuis]SHK67665.1 hypothetical protein SAMN02745243_03486 [Hespellia stercorisuis DSM 15480]
MKNNWLQITIKIYKIWSAVLFVFFLVSAENRCHTFYLWQLSTALIILFLLVDITILFHKKRKLLKMGRAIKLLEQRLDDQCNLGKERK